MSRAQPLPPSTTAFSIPAQALEHWTRGVLIRVGLTEDDAALAAAGLVDADRRGYATHGIARLDAYVARLRTGEINPTPRIVFAEQGGVLSIDGDLGLGQAVGVRAVDAALSRLGGGRAAQIFLLKRSGHLGALGYYVRRAALAGKVALIAQVSQPIMAPRGALAPAIGNNPIALAAPMPDGPPLVVDLSCSRVARGNVFLAARTGETIPDDWAIGRDGRPTTDPAEALLGAMLPMGDHKGLALAMLVQVLAGSLTGTEPHSGASKGVAIEVGAFGLVADPDALVGRDAFDAHMARWTAHYRAAIGEHGRLPGRAAPADDVRLTEAIRDELAALGTKVGLPLPSGTDRHDH
jgi:LDH2 family malate/lactate/ureidoglycolate dehydrogenase